MVDSDQQLTCDEVELIGRFLRIASQKFDLSRYRDANIDVIQRAWRCCAASILTTKVKDSAALLYNVSRRFTITHGLKKAKEAANVLQRFFRSQKDSTTKTSATTLIYRVCRSYLDCKLAIQLRGSALTVQKEFRACATFRQQMTMLGATVTIQAHFCAYYGDILRLHRVRNAIKVIQRHTRGEITGTAPAGQRESGMKRPPQILKKRNDASSQQQFSQHEIAACKLLYRVYRKKFSAGGYNIAKIVTIQALARGILARKAEVANTLASAAIYQHYRRKRCFLTKLGATQLQKLLKGPLAVVYARRMKYAIQAIYSHMRCSRLCSALRAKLAAARVIQSLVKQINVRRALPQEAAAAYRIQQHYRKIIARRQYRTRYRAAACLQKYWRAAALHAKMTTERHGAMQLQALFRSKSKALYREKIGLFVAALAATVIQRSSRRFEAKAVASERENSAIVIQKCGRAFLTVDNLCLYSRAAVILYTQYRREAPKDIQELYIYLLAALQIQQSARLFAFGCAFCRFSYASVKLQAFYKTLSLNRALKRKAEASAVIAAIFRRIRYYKREYTELHAALCIYKAFSVQMMANRVVLSIEKIYNVLIEKYERDNPLAVYSIY